MKPSPELEIMERLTRVHASLECTVQKFGGHMKPVSVTLLEATLENVAQALYDTSANLKASMQD